MEQVYLYPPIAMQIDVLKMGLFQSKYVDYICLAIADKFSSNCTPTLIHWYILTSFSPLKLRKNTATLQQTKKQITILNVWALI